MSLKVHTRFPGGNARVMSVQNDAQFPEIRFAADPLGGPEALWFCFRAVETEPEKPHAEKLKITLCFPDTMLGVGSGGACRPVYQPQGQGWFRLASGAEHALPDGRTEVSWVIPHPEPLTEVALCYPYGRAEVDALVRKSAGYWRADEIGLTQSGHPIQRLSCDYGQAGGHAPGVYLVARQHAGETPGSWVLDGFLDRFAREKKGGYVVWSVPLMDGDGVERGEYGKDAFPYDLNRAWGRPPMRHETLVVQHDMQRWAQRCKPRLALDFHAPGGCEGKGMYVYVPDPEKQPSEHKEAVSWANVFANTLGPEFAAEDFARVGRYASRWETARFTDFARAELGCAALSIETPYAVCGPTIMTQKQYREAGRLLAKAVLTKLK